VNTFRELSLYHLFTCGNTISDNSAPFTYMPLKRGLLGTTLCDIFLDPTLLSTKSSKLRIINNSQIYSTIIDTMGQTFSVGILLLEETGVPEGLANLFFYSFTILKRKH
jgi:hypothetical protein